MRINSSHFLTPQMKKKELRELKQWIKRGDVDEEFIAWLKVINEIPGVCSKFCCTGHHYRGGGSEGGNLIVYLSETKYERLMLGSNPSYCYVKSGGSVDFCFGICRMSFTWPVDEFWKTIPRIVRYLSEEDLY